MFLRLVAFRSNAVHYINANQIVRMVEEPDEKSHYSMTVLHLRDGHSIGVKESISEILQCIQE